MIKDFHTINMEKTQEIQIIIKFYFAGKQAKMP